MELKLFNEKEIQEFKEIAILFKINRNLIINNWFISHDSLNIPNFNYMKKGIEMLVDSFIKNFLVGDLANYLEENQKIARLVTSKDVSYDLFIDSFHEFEGSYAEVLAQYYGNKAGHKAALIDKLHHKTISILAKEYFELRDRTIFAMVKLVESRDKETGYHLERTREYSKILASKLNCDKEFIRQIYEVSPLHDIGKVGIPDSILLKEDSLNEEEIEIMKTHVKIGGDTINYIIKDLNIESGRLIMAREIAYYHHEKYDGTGYYGLIGEEIPLSSRIFMVADIYDALTSKRSYKIAFSHDETCKIILEGDGRTKPEHFDPNVLKAFSDCQNDFLRIYNNYKE